MKKPLEFQRVCKVFSEKKSSEEETCVFLWNWNYWNVLPCTIWDMALRLERWQSAWIQKWHLSRCSATEGPWRYRILLIEQTSKFVDVTALRKLFCGKHNAPEIAISISEDLPKQNYCHYCKPRYWTQHCCGRRERFWFDYFFACRK